MNEFAAQRASRQHTIHLAAPPEQVFRLFEPLGEAEWAAEWSPIPLYPASGAAEYGAVFTTHGSGDVWTIVRYEPPHAVAYLMVRPTSHVSRIEVECRPDGATTSATIGYTITSLTAQGNAYIAAMDEAHFRHWIDSWEQAINHYLRHGARLAHH